MVKPTSKPKGRYEIRDILGEGGMGVVYRAFDPVLKREVTLKTIRDPQDTAVLELFKRECDVLAGMGGHPNIVEIFDIGEIDDGTGRKPYFVMPLLKGVTLDQLIRNASTRLTIERCVQMITQVCRGLQAAHDQGLVHRDLKPSNIFVLEDDSIKIIDFGVAHLIDQRSVTGLKGTLLYMAPEQLQLKKPTPVSDQFSLAVITYEMLTRRHPFNSPGYEDLAQAILNSSPPPTNEINPLVPPLVSQVIHKALAKQPFHRFPNVREYADCLQKALRNEPIEIFDPARVEPRLLRAQKAFSEGDVDFASEIIRELKSESYLNPEIDRLEKEISDTTRAKSVKQLLDTARRRFNEHEHILALQKVQEVLNLDPTNRDAITLEGKIESSRNTSQVEEWLRLAQRHLDNHAYTHARQAMEKLLDLRPDDARARAFLGEIDRREQEAARIKAEKQRAYESAMASFKRGDVKSALSKLEHCIQADRLTPSSSSDQATAYQKLYEEVRSKRDQLEAKRDEARRNLAEGKYDAARLACESVLKEFPENLEFTAMRDDAEQGLRKESSAFVASVEQEVTEEADLDKKVAILEQAQARYPGEARFELSLRQVRSRKDLVDSIVARAHASEESGQFSEAFAQWETLSNIHPQYPGLKVEMERVTKRRQQQAQAGVKAGWVAQIDQAVNVHNYERAASLVKEALAEFPGDSELLTLEQTIQQLSDRQAEAEDQLAQAKALDQAGKTDLGIELLRGAYQQSPQYQSLRNGLIDLLLKQAGALLDTNWAGAEPLVAEAAAIEPKNALAKSLKTLIADKKQTAEVALCLSQARALQGQGNSREAIRVLDQGLAPYPREIRLIQLRATLSRGLTTNEREELRTQDLQELRKLEERSKTETDARGLDMIVDRTRIFRGKYGDDKEFKETITAIEERTGKKVAVEPVHLDASWAAGGRSAEATRLLSATGGKPEPKESSKPTSGKLPANYLQIVYGLLGAVAAGLLIYLVISFTRTTEKPVPVASRVPIVVKIDDAAAYRIEDSSGKDVTADARTAGLNPAEYHLKATRAGFAPVDLAFNIPPGEKQHELSPTWTALLSRLTIRNAAPGEATIDDMPMATDGADLVADLANGMHKVKWSSGGYGAELAIEARDGTVVRAGSDFKPNPNLGVLIASVGSQKINYESFGLTLAGMPPKGDLDLPAENAAVQIKSNVALLAELRRLDAKYSAAMLVSFVMPAGTRTSNRRGVSPGSAGTAPPAASPTPGSASPPVIAPAESPEDKQRRELQQELERLSKRGKQ